MKSFTCSSLKRIFLCFCSCSVHYTIFTRKNIIFFVLFWFSGLTLEKQDEKKANVSRQWHLVANPCTKHNEHSVAYENEFFMMKKILINFQ